MTTTPGKAILSLAGALCSLAVAQPARADGGTVPRVAVVVALEVNVKDAEAKRLATALAGTLRAKLLVDVVTPAEVARRLPPSGFSAECVAQAPCIRDLASRTSADQLLFLVMTRVGSRVQIDPTWADATGRTASRDALSIVDGGKPAKAVFAAAAQDLLPDARVRPPAPKTDVVTTHIAVPVSVAQPRGRHMTTAAWIAAGTGAVSFTGGVVFGVLALSDYHSLKDQGCGTTMACVPGANRLHDRALLADVLYGVSLAAAATSAVLYYFSASVEPDASPAVTVAPSPGGASLSIGGRF